MKPGMAWHGMARHGTAGQHVEIDNVGRECKACMMGARGRRFGVAAKMDVVHEKKKKDEAQKGARREQQAAAAACHAGKQASKHMQNKKKEGHAARAPGPGEPPRLWMRMLRGARYIGISLSLSRARAL